MRWHLSRKWNDAVSHVITWGRAFQAVGTVGITPQHLSFGDTSRICQDRSLGLANPFSCQRKEQAVRNGLPTQYPFPLMDQWCLRWCPHLLLWFQTHIPKELCLEEGCQCYLCLSFTKLLVSYLVTQSASGQPVRYSTVIKNVGFGTKCLGLNLGSATSKLLNPSVPHFCHL